MTETSTDVLIIGAGGAGLYAAISAARHGADVLLLDKSLIGRGGATVMAQMTVAAAIGHEEPDDWEAHLADTLKAGRGLVDRELAEIVCREAPERILEMDSWKVRWARSGDRIKQVVAPGHSAKRCVYVDFLSTGPAVSRTLRGQVNKCDRVRRAGDICITGIEVSGGRAVGAGGYNVGTGEPVHIAAKAVIIATGGLTHLYQRNSASVNMGGDGYALALRAGAELQDMEFVQFFPIGHLAPRLIGMDPIMWDPFRYKLGGRLLNADGEEFLYRYGVAEESKYIATRDLATYAILKEVEAGRGSPHGGAYLSFEHIPAKKLKEAFGPVIDKLADNDIDLSERPVEVAPIAHYHMGGIRVDPRMETKVRNLFAAGEAVGGSNGANRLSGNAISETFVFGERAGRFAAVAAAEAMAQSDIGARPTNGNDPNGAGDAKPYKSNPAKSIAELQSLMWQKVGPFRNAEGLDDALAEIRRMRSDLEEVNSCSAGPFDMRRIDRLSLENMLLVAEAVTLSAIERTESRGAHQREDFPETSVDWLANLIISQSGSELGLKHIPIGTNRNPEEN